MSAVREFFRTLRRPCREMTHLASEALDRPVPRSQRLALAIHTWYCVGCRRYRRQVRLLHAALCRLADHLQQPAPTPGPRLSAAARERIRRALREA